MPCNEISAEWGAQRIKGLSIGQGALARAAHARSQRRVDRAEGHRDQPDRAFLYPKYGPGPDVGGGRADGARARRRDASRHARWSRIDTRRASAWSASTCATRDRRVDATRRRLLSSRPCRSGTGAAFDARGAGRGRATSPTGCLPRLHHRRACCSQAQGARRGAPETGRLIPDNWIYIQEPDVQLGRLQIFNNWSPYMVARSEQGLARARVLLQRGRRAVAHARTPR